MYVHCSGYFDPNYKLSQLKSFIIMGKKKLHAQKHSSSKKAVTSFGWFGQKKAHGIAIIFSIVLAACIANFMPYLQKVDSSPFAPSSDHLSVKYQNVSCSDKYKNYPMFSGCTPTKVCGRCVKDGIVSAHEVHALRNIIENGMLYGGSSGGASILDLHSGALSKEEKFINIYKSLSKEQLSKAFSQEGINTYVSVKNKVKAAIAQVFGINPGKLYLTKPTFFSRMTSAAAKTKHDEYWHSHIDKIQYGSFDYTALIYLSTYGEDFEGGQFVFDDSNVTVEPKSGRMSFFTSGFENPHHVEKVTSGTRYAVTIAFTCDPNQAIKDPTFS